MPRPDLTIYLDVPPEDSEKLLSYVVGVDGKVPDLAEKDREHQRRVAECAKYLMSSRDKWVTVQCIGEGGLRTREEIHDEVVGIVKEHL